MECPVCGNDGVTPSERVGIEIPLRFFWPLHPYRCRECWTRFWRYDARLAMVSVLSILGIALAIWAGSLLIGFLTAPTGPPVEATPAPVSRRIVQREAIPLPDERPETADRSKTASYESGDDQTPKASSDASPNASNEASSDAPSAALESSADEALPGDGSGGDIVDADPQKAPALAGDGPALKATVDSASTAGSAPVSEKESATVSDSSGKTNQVAAEAISPETSQEAEQKTEAAHLTDRKDKEYKMAKGDSPATSSPKKNLTSRSKTTAASGPSQARTAETEMPAKSSATETTADDSFRLTGVQATPQADGLHIELSAGKTVSDWKSFYLKKPPRLVIDLPGRWKIKDSIDIPITGTSVKALRIGYHNAFLRMVADLRSEGSPEVSAESGKDGLRLVIGKAVSASKADTTD